MKKKKSDLDDLDDEDDDKDKEKSLLNKKKKVSFLFEMLWFIVI